MNGHQDIGVRQRDAESGRLLRAYSSQYRRAKRYRTIRFAVSGCLALAGPLISLWSLTAAGVVGAAAGLWVLVTRLVLIPVERSRVGCGVRIQERFDTRLFDLPWPEALAGEELSEEDIADAARRLETDSRLTEHHADGWYPSTTGLPWPVDVLVAQWSSAVYARRQHEAYFWFLVVSTGALAFVEIFIGVVASLSLTDWLITFLLPSLPALLDVSELADAHRRIAAEKRAIESKITKLWRRELESIGATSMEDCRAVQDAAFKLREKGLQIPEWFYWFHRDRNEANMNDAATARRTQYQQSVGSSI